MSQDSRNYYDEQFGGRINEIAKPGATPPRSSGSGSTGGGWGMRSVGGVIAVIVMVVIRVALFSSRSSSTYTPPTYQYTPPPNYNVPSQRFDFQPKDPFPQQDANDWNKDDKGNDFGKGWEKEGLKDK